MFLSAYTAHARRGVFCAARTAFFFLILCTFGERRSPLSSPALRFAKRAKDRAVSKPVLTDCSPVIKQTLLFCTAQGYDLQDSALKNLAMANFTFADKILFCHLSDMNFADGQRRTCRLQIFSLPSANENFAVGKCLAGRRQNSYRINGKFLVCHREIC